MTSRELGDGHHLPALAHCRFGHMQWPTVPSARSTTTGINTQACHFSAVGSLVPNMSGPSVVLELGRWGEAFTPC